MRFEKKGGISTYKGSPHEELTVSRTVLGILGVLGLVSLAVLAPNALQMLTLFQADKAKNKRKSARLQYDITATIKRLQREECVILEQHDGETLISLTKKGEQRLLKYRLQGVAVPEPSQWDQKWRVVIFDIHEKRRFKRNRLREELKRFGFLQLQQSVWVYPYDCEDFIAMLKIDQKLWSSVLYMVVEKVENDSLLRKRFNLVL